MAITDVESYLNQLVGRMGYKRLCNDLPQANRDSITNQFSQLVELYGLLFWNKGVIAWEGLEHRRLS